jgi:hypothetical protein
MYHHVDDDRYDGCVVLDSLIANDPWTHIEIDNAPGQHFFYRGLYGVPVIYLISDRLFFDNKADPGVRREKAKKELFSSWHYSVYLLE